MNIGRLVSTEFINTNRSPYSVLLVAGSPGARNGLKMKMKMMPMMIKKIQTKMHMLKESKI
jgi:hypothetical protein